MFETIVFEEYIEDNHFDQNKTFKDRSILETARFIYTKSKINGVLI
jgi:hypothetical protein